MKEIILKELKSELLTPRGYLWYILSSIILSILSYLFLTNIELSLLDQSTMVFFLMEAVLSLGILHSIIYGSDSYAGEIERGTMEVLLLTPVRKTSIAFGKFTVSVMNWFILFLISIPYLVVVGKGGQNVSAAITYLFILGTLIIMTITGFNMILSIKLKSVKNAVLVGMLVFFLLGTAIILPPSLKHSSLVRYLDLINPVAAAVNSFDSVVIDSEGFEMQVIRIIIILIYLAVVMLLLKRISQNDELIAGAR
jgi:ABC-type transport system involved in multi-copper enzyme maturation permease subunit